MAKWRSALGCRLEIVLSAVCVRKIQLSEERIFILISETIDEYVYLTPYQTFEEGFFLKYSKFEKGQEIDEMLEYMTQVIAGEITNAV